MHLCRTNESVQNTPGNVQKVSLSPSSVVQMLCRLSFISPEQIKEAAFNPGIITLRSLSYHGGITVIKMGYSEAPGPRSFVMA